jgi:hypothetical protein
MHRETDALSVVGQHTEEPRYARHALVSGLSFVSERSPSWLGCGATRSAAWGDRLSLRYPRTLR